MSFGIYLIMNNMKYINKEDFIESIAESQRVGILNEEAKSNILKVREGIIKMFKMPTTGYVEFDNQLREEFFNNALKKCFDLFKKFSLDKKEHIISYFTAIFKNVIIAQIHRFKKQGDILLANWLISQRNKKWIKI